MTSPTPRNGDTTYIVEHLDPELEQWSALEYRGIARESRAAGAQFILSSVPASLADNLPSQLLKEEDKSPVDGLSISGESVENIYTGDLKATVCLLDPAAKQELSPEDAKWAKVFLFGGILGDDPPRDRTSELRKKGFEGRRLGPVQMTTDTAVRVTRIVIQDQIPLEKIEYIDHPELKINANESTQMPFRYVRGKNGEPVMPEGMIDLIKSDSERGFGDLL